MNFFESVSSMNRTWER